MKILTVYNTCGINGDKIDWYIQCIESILRQDYKNQKVVVSSCLNSEDCMRRLKKKFGDKIIVCLYRDRYIVNTTFNKTVLEFGKDCDAYFFLDSGVDLGDDTSVLSQMVERLSDSSMVSVQTDTDTGFESIGLKQDSDISQVKEDIEIPVGKGINLHCQLFSRDILDTFGLVIPDVFAAYCTESTFSFLNACVEKKWKIIKDVIVHHNKAVDGPSSSQPHWSPVHRTPWNNLLYGRDARDFIHDPQAISAGLGYEECGKIMLHDDSAYSNGIPKHKQELIDSVKKYFYSNKEELNYAIINTTIF